MKRILAKKILMKKILMKKINNFIKNGKNYYQKHKERLRKEASERYQNFTEEEKEKRHQYYQKQKLPEYRRNYYLAHKKQLLGHFIHFLGPGTM